MAGRPRVRLQSKPFSLKQSRIAKALRESRNWVTWPHCNITSDKIADALEFTGDRKLDFMRLAGALDDTNNYRAKP